jgi:hypothetical protein
VTADSLIPAAQYGLRAWSVVGEPGAERLASLHEPVRWPPAGWLVATCPNGHEAPGHECSCGIHGWHPRLRAARRVLAARATIGGVLEAVGAVEVHGEGFRAQRARPYALAVGRSNPALIRRLATVYGAEVIETRDPRAVVAWCRDRDLGLDDAVVQRLIGSGESERLQRSRRRDAARVAAVVLAIAALLGVGLAATGDPGHRTLHGRTGPIEVGR